MDESINLLATKFSINHVYRSRAVARGKLFKLLDDAANNKLTLISAPAGFGKTTLLSSWITMCKKRSICAAWLNLDEDDNDETRFWLYFASAIKAVIPNMGEKAIKLFQSARIGGMETAITVLINEILDTKKKFLFIIEDLHVIKNETVPNTLKFFINHKPDNIHMIVTSRTDILSILSGIKSGGKMMMIGQEELRFTNEETAVFVSEIMGLKISEEDLMKLYKLTEGWPAGLQMMALTCKRKGIEVINGKADRVLSAQLADYFIEDLLISQSPAVYEFLVKTSLMDTFTYDLCVAALEIPNCRELLDQVLEMNLFISSLEDKGNWYRYHSLFAGFLKKKTEEEQPDLARSIYKKAGAWYENKGYRKEAGTCYLKAKDYEKAVTLIGEVSRDLIYQGQFTMLEKWVEAIPVQYLYASPRLMLDYVWVHLSKHKIDEAAYYIEMIEKEFKETEAVNDPAFKGEFLIAKAFISMENLEESIELLEESMELVDSFNPNYPAALMSIATSYITHGELVQAQLYYVKALAASQKIENLYSAAYSWGSLGMMMTYQGRFGKAEALYQEAEIYLKEKGGSTIPLLGIVFSGLSEIYYYKNQIEEAYTFSSKAAELFERGGIFDIKNNCYVIKARALIAKGNKQDAIEVINKALILSEKDKLHGFKRHVDFSKARMYLDMNEIEEAEDFIRQYSLSFKDDIKKYDLHDYILLAEILIKKNAFEKGFHCINKIMQSGQIGKFYEVQLNMLKADALFNLSETEAACDALYNALTDCLKENYIRLFINYGRRLEAVLKTFIDCDSRYDQRSIDYAKHILSFYQDKQVNPAKKEAVLSKRELEVLRLIEEGASNEEIAKELFISVSTVKSHTLNIFGKLGVKSRSKAVVEAEKRGIIHTFY